MIDEIKNKIDLWIWENFADIKDSWKYCVFSNSVFADRSLFAFDLFLTMYYETEFYQLLFDLGIPINEYKLYRTYFLKIYENPELHEF